MCIINKEIFSYISIVTRRKQKVKNFFSTQYKRVLIISEIFIFTEVFTLNCCFASFHCLPRFHKTHIQNKTFGQKNVILGEYNSYSEGEIVLGRLDKWYWGTITKKFYSETWKESNLNVNLHLFLRDDTEREHVMCSLSVRVCHS